PDFLSNLQSIPDSAMTAAASALDAKLDEILVVSESSFIVDPYGMWFYMPAAPYEYYNDFYVYSNQSVVDTFENEYYGLDFVNNTNWDNFLVQWKIELETVIPQVSTVTSVTDTLIAGTHTYIYTDLPDPGVGYAYEATLTMDVSVDFDLYVWSEEYYFGLPNGFDVFSENYDDEPEILLIVIDDATRVFFLVNAFVGTGSYTLELDVVEYNDDIFEENDDILSAAPIAVNTVYSLIASDADYFSVELTAPFTIEISLTFNTLVVDLDLYLIADDGSGLASSLEYTSTEFISYSPSYTGTYYIWVNYWEGNLGESYDLEVSVSEDPVISNFGHSPYSPEQGETITINCDVDAMYTIVEVTLSLSFDGGALEYITMTNAGGHYTATFAPPEGTEVVTCSVYVEDSQGNSAVSLTRYISIDSPDDTETITFPWMLLPLLLFGLATINRLRIKKKR
ncbi:MAG: PPC domain-containing protein, partial [Candidatus Heimdallarchaeaceae archaeon]